MAKKKICSDEQVLEKALPAISQHGAETFTLQNISEVVGLSPATLLQRFGSKQQLLIRAAKHATAKLQKDLRNLQNKNLSWDTELLSLLCAVPENFGSRENIASSLSLLKLDIIDKELHPTARKLFQQLRLRIYELLILAKNCGDISPSTNINAMTWELDAIRHGLVIQWALSGKGSLQRWLKDGLLNYLKRIRL